MEKKRIDYIDVIRGIVMLLVIIGHTIPDSAVRAMIYSFHMPLLFIISGYTSKLSKDGKAFTRKAGRSFLKLILITCGIVLIKSILFWFAFGEPISLDGYYQALFMGSVETVPLGMMWEGFPPVGIVWFSFALFGSKLIWDALSIVSSRVLLCFGVISITFSGVLLGQYQWLPLCLDCGMAVLIFLYIGCTWKEKINDKLQVKYLILLIVVWIGSFIVYYFSGHKYLDIANRLYPLFPVCYISAIAGSLFVIEIGKTMCKQQLIRIFKWIGKNTMVIYFVHYMDDIFVTIWKIESRLLLSCIARIIIVLVISGSIVMLIDALKKQKNVSGSASM